MNPSERVITQLPVAQLWNEAGIIVATPAKDVSRFDIQQLLRAGRVRFVVTDVGTKPHWVPEADCYVFWKTEVQPHFAGPGREVFLEEFPGHYCYVARAWSPRDGAPIVELQRYH